MEITEDINYFLTNEWNMKQIRYNDRLWFGKYKGVRAHDIMATDPCYFNKFIDEQKISLDNRLTEKMKKRTNSILNSPRFDYDPPTFPVYDEQVTERVTRYGNEEL